jgi:hypothetical protein
MPMPRISFLESARVSSEVLKWDYRIDLNANLYPARPQVFNVWKYNRTWRAIVYEGSAARG